MEQNDEIIIYKSQDGSVKVGVLSSDENVWLIQQHPGTGPKCYSNNILKIYGEEKGYGNEVKFQWNDVFAGHLSSIIGYLPAINEVDDVSDMGSITTVLESITKNS